MKVRNPKQLDFVQNIEPMAVAQDHLFFNNLKHSLKKKHVYLSNLSSLDNANTRFLKLDILFGSKFFRFMKLKLQNKKFDRFNKQRNLKYEKPVIRSRIVKKKKKIPRDLRNLKKQLVRVVRLRKLLANKTILKKILSPEKRFKKKKLQLKLKYVSEGFAQQIKNLRSDIVFYSPGNIYSRNYNPLFFSQYAKKYVTKSNAFSKIRKRFFDKNKKTKKFQKSSRFNFKRQKIHVKNKSFTRKLKRTFKSKLKNLEIKKTLEIKRAGLIFNQNFLKINQSIHLGKNIEITINPLNFKVYKPLYFNLFKLFRRFKYKLFPRNELFYFDFIAMLSLLARQEISLSVFGNALSNILGSIHKKKHKLFIALLTKISRQMVSVENSLISGMKFTFSGRIFGNNMAKSEILTAGSSELTTIRTFTDHVALDAFTVYGIFGIQIWVAFKSKNTSFTHVDFNKLKDGLNLKSPTNLKSKISNTTNFLNKKTFSRIMKRKKSVKAFLATSEKQSVKDKLTEKINKGLYSMVNKEKHSKLKREKQKLKLKLENLFLKKLKLKSKKKQIKDSSL